MSIGDHEPADSFDVAPPDPEQVARKLRAFEGGEWQPMSPGEKLYRIALMARLIEWGRREGWVR